MKQFYFSIIALLLLTATQVQVQAQEKVMQIHSSGSVVYEIPTAQVDSITFKAEEDVFPKTIIPAQLACENLQESQAGYDLLERYPTEIFVIRSQSDWDYFLTGIIEPFYDIQTKFSEINIDFSKHHIIATIGPMHYKAIDDYCSIDITGAMEYADKVVVDYNIKYIENAGTGKGRYSFQIVKMPSTDKNVFFQRKPTNNENPLETVSFSEYSLSETSCKWTSFDDNNTIIINSYEELEEYIVCTGDNRPEIDFSKHTLLLAKGGVPGGVAKLSKKILVSLDRCVLEVEIIPDFTAVNRTAWFLALITNKISSEIEAKLSIIKIH